jgi:SAM-dependent methyltransferase
MNAGEDVVEVTVHGKKFKTSLTMAKQAEGFQAVCDQLIDLGCVVTVDGDGMLPFMVRENARRAALDPQTEQEKYEAMWTLAEYRAVAPGEHVAEAFAEISKVGKDDIVIDFGCGTGRGAKKIHDLTGCDFVLLDFTTNSLDEQIRVGDWFTFAQQDLTKPIPFNSKYGFCTDVMEHIPPDDVDAVIQNIMRASERVFFQISLVDDACGALIGRPLHLSVHPFDWWKEKFLAMGYRIEWSQDCGESALFYIAR